MKLTELDTHNDLVTALVFNPESIEYSGCSYTFNKKNFVQRTAKITPKKIGQFVTLWKRDQAGETCPLEQEDDFDFVIIICKKDKLFGRFLFPKSILIEKSYIQSPKHEGKRGFRVYPDWDTPLSKQAIKTQGWQSQYFERTLTLNKDELIG